MAIICFIRCSSIDLLVRQAKVPCHLVIPELRLEVSEVPIDNSI